MDRRARGRLVLGLWLALLVASHVVRAARDDAVPADWRRDDGTWRARLAVAAVDGERRLPRPAVLAVRVRPPRARDAATDASAPAARAEAGRPAPSDPAGGAATGAHVGARGVVGSTGTAGSPPVVVLVHGSPGRGEHMAALAAELPGELAVVVPDLAGFGASTRSVPDYSIRAQADYLAQLLDTLGVERAHLVGFSLGGAVALHLWERDPERVASITLLSATAVQELELLGDHHLNHALHALQLALIRGAQELIPHFGALDGMLGGRGYARSFFDSDQRPLRAILRRYDGPMLVLHGEDDFLVPVEAAREHARIVPQSELALLPKGHFLVFTDPALLATAIGAFVARAADGRAATRAQADPARLAAAAEPFDHDDVPPISGAFLLLVMALLGAATLVSEDLTCIGAGLLVAQGRLPFVAASLGCLTGIFVGDVALYLAGRWLGRPALARAPLRWIVSADRVERSARWFERRGIGIIFASRFLPGTRLPTYVAAGVLGMKLSTFALCFLAAAVLWTPMLVGLAALAGQQAYELLDGTGLLGLGLVALALLVVARVGLLAASHRGRRQLAGRWRRLTHWEFWPPWAFYPPVLLYVALLALRHRSLAIVSAVNPGIPGGGLVGESKGDILAQLAGAGERVARTERLEPGVSDVSDVSDASHAGAGPPDTPGAGDAAVEARIAQVQRFMRRHGLGYPVVIKPDVGERGAGVAILRSEAALREHLARARGTLLAQEYVPGLEWGLFYVRAPGAERGRIISVTEKHMPVVVGDGERTLEELILDDERAVCMSATYFACNAQRLETVPAAGEPIQLVELGTHCRGAIFLDGRLAPPDERVEGPELLAVLDRISAHVRGFHFGRYDVRAPSVAALRSGDGFKVIELNGLTSEATHIYDPRHGLLSAYRTLFAQWRLAFEIAAANRRAGIQPTPLSRLLASVVDFVRRKRG